MSGSKWADPSNWNLKPKQAKSYTTALSSWTWHRSEQNKQMHFIKHKPWWMKDFFIYNNNPVTVWKGLLWKASSTPGLLDLGRQRQESHLNSKLWLYNKIQVIRAWGRQKEILHKYKLPSYLYLGTPCWTSFQYVLKNYCKNTYWIQTRFSKHRLTGI